MARKEWLVNDEKSSRYCYQTSKACGRIVKIKDSFGAWVDGAA